MQFNELRAFDGEAQSHHEGAADVALSAALAPPQTVNDTLPYRQADFATLTEALDYAALGQTGCAFYTARGELDAVWSYRDLRDAARATARKLLALQLPRLSRVAILAETSADFMRVFYACQYAGLLPVPFPVPSSLGGRDSHVEHLRRLLIRSQAQVAIAPSDDADLQAAAAGLTLAYCGTSAAFEARPEAALSLTPLGADEDSHLQYSSGSTRSPAGVTITQRAMMVNARSIARDGIAIGPEDRCSSWLPFYHDMGLIGFVLVPMTCQRSVDYLAPDAFARRPLEWLKMIARNRATLSFSPSFGFELCVRRARRLTETLDLSSWRVAGIGGEMVRADKMTEFADTFAQHGFRAESFVPSYGLAEATLAVSFAPLDRGVEVDVVDREVLAAEQIAVPPAAGAPAERHRPLVKCGAPLAGYQVEIRDETGAVLADRHVGTVFIKAPSLMRGYFDDEEATVQVLDADGWLNTGDRGYCVDGTLVITGRSKDLLIVNGRNIWPQDLEGAAEELAEVRARDAAAFAVETDGGEEKAVVLIQCRLSDSAAREELTRSVHAAVQRKVGIDCRVALIPPGSLPFTTSGKLSRSRARQEFLSGRYNSAQA